MSDFVVAVRLLPLLALAACQQTARVEEVRRAKVPTTQRVVVSVTDQMMVTFEREVPKKIYPVSTSKFGTGDRPRSFKTPLGRLEVVDVIGLGLAAGARLKAREPTGEIVPLEAPGRDPIVTRVVRLRGMERRNARTLERLIYIHGTPEESKLKTAVSFGCVRMGAANIIALCQWLKPGARVDIVAGKLPAPEDLPD